MPTYLTIGEIDDQVDAAPSDATCQIAHVPDIADRAIAKLKHRLRQPRIEALVRAICKGIQLQEDLNFALIVERTIDDAQGAQLDQWGSLVGEARDGVSDIDYRVYIKARILVNTGSGYINDLIRLWSLLTAPSAVRHKSLFPGAMKFFAVRSEWMSDYRAARVARLMQAARPAGRFMVLIEAHTGYFGFDTDVDAEGYGCGHFARVIG